MRGRFRQICQGIDVDLGTAAMFRDVWASEAPAHHDFTSTPLLLNTTHNAGDAVAMTAAIYSLHRAYPGRYRTAVKGWSEVFQYNPDVVPISEEMAMLYMHYPAVRDSNDRGIHFMQAWCEHLGKALGISVPLLTNRPHLYFTNAQPPPGDFWLICSGGKGDFTAKRWGGYQEVVSLLKRRVRFVQVGAAGDDHPHLDGAENLVGKTHLRTLFNLTRRARGVLCGVSLLMHVAAALEKSAVVIAGGREPVQWNSYPKQQYIHTVGLMPCASYRGRVGEACWRSRVHPLGDGSHFDQDICERPDGDVAGCMSMIRPESVAELVMRYNELGV